MMFDSFCANKANMLGIILPLQSPDHAPGAFHSGIHCVAERWRRFVSEGHQLGGWFFVLHVELIEKTTLLCHTFAFWIRLQDSSIGDVKAEQGWRTVECERSIFSNLSRLSRVKNSWSLHAFIARKVRPLVERCWKYEYHPIGPH